MNRYCICKDGKRAGGSVVWAVYDDVAKKIVESGFFNKAAAQASADEYNAEAAGK